MSVKSDQSRESSVIPALPIVPKPKVVPLTLKTCPSVPVMSAGSPELFSLRPITDKAELFLNFVLVTASSAILLVTIVPKAKSPEPLRLRTLSAPATISAGSPVPVVALPITL
ncbi:hypothetical protein ES703_82538 [subsurface metagenome]